MVHYGSLENLPAKAPAIQAAWHHGAPNLPVATVRASSIQKSFLAVCQSCGFHDLCISNVLGKAFHTNMSTDTSVDNIHDILLPCICALLSLVPLPLVTRPRLYKAPTWSSAALPCSFRMQFVQYDMTAD